MNLKRHSFYKGDSYKISITSQYINLSPYTITFYMHSNTRELLTNPIITINEGSNLIITNNDNGALIEVLLSPSITESLTADIYYYTVKLTEGITKKETVENGMIVFQSFMGDYYVSRFRKYLKDIKTKNKGEFLNLEENEDSELSDFLYRALSDFNHSFFITEYTIDNFPDESLLFLGGLLQSLISNGTISARCALTYQDATGILIRDMDRWGRYQGLFGMYFSQWRQRVMEYKRSWNIENSFDEVRGDGYFEDSSRLTIDGDAPDEFWS